MSFLGQPLSVCHQRKRAYRALTWSFLGVTLLTVSACQDAAPLSQRATIAMASMITYEDHRQPIEPLPTNNGQLDAKSRLGKLLFHDKRLSRDNTVSCASCHNLAEGGDDGRTTALGIGGATGSINSPTVLNATLNIAQFWDGRASSLEAQVAGPIHAANEMGSSWDEVIAKINSDLELKNQFHSLFPEGITANSITECIASYEKLLITPDCPFDKFLRGNEEAVSADVVEGYRLFRELGCASCHQGRGVGGNLYQQFGVMREFLDGSLDAGDSQDGPAAATGTRNKLDERRFKVPMLRNVALTAPYLHDGSAETLEDAVEVMGMYQLGADLSADEIRLLVTFLRSLTGVLNEELK